MPQKNSSAAGGCAATRQDLLRYLVEERELFLCDAIRILGNRDGAEDVVQNAAIRCLESPAINTDIISPRGLVRRIVRNLAMDQLRRNARERAVPIEPGEEPCCFRPNPEEQLEERDTLTHVVRAIDDLPERSRKIFLSHRLEEHLQKDIARQFALSPARINNILTQAHSRVQKTMEEQ